MKSQIPALFLGMVCVVLALSYIRSNQTVKLQQQIIEELQRGDILKDSPQADAATDLQEPAINPSEPSAQRAAIRNGEQPSGESVTHGQRMMQHHVKMSDNPAMNKVDEAMTRGAMMAKYADLIDYLSLNDQEARYFIDLLVYRAMGSSELSAKLLSGSYTLEEEQAFKAESDKLEKTAVEEIKKFLNNADDFAEFEYFEETMSERVMLSEMDKDLSGTGSELSDATYRELLDIMNDEWENYTFTSSTTDQQEEGKNEQSHSQRLISEYFSKEALQNYANDRRKIDENIFQKAKTILAPEQYEAFVNCVKADTEMDLNRHEIAAKMFSDGK